MNCGPVNDLKRLGGRIDVDHSRIQDRTLSAPSALASGSRSQAFRALPTSGNTFSVQSANRGKQVSNDASLHAPQERRTGASSDWSHAYQQQHPSVHSGMHNKGKSRGNHPEPSYDMEAAWGGAAGHQATRNISHAPIHRSAGRPEWNREFNQASASGSSMMTNSQGNTQIRHQGMYTSPQIHHGVSQYPHNFQHQNQPFNWMPSVSEPQFSADGRLRHDLNPAESGLETIQQGWTDVFDQIEREFTSSTDLNSQQTGDADQVQGNNAHAVHFADVPRNLEEALSRAKDGAETSGLHYDTTSVAGANMQWEEEIADSTEGQEEEDDFDQAGFAAFYGREWQPGGTPQSRAHEKEAATRAAELQHSLHGISSTEAEALLDRGQHDLVHEHLAKARSLGYLVNQPKALRREEVGRYLFNKENPYVGLSPEQKARVASDKRQALQYQNVLQHEASVLDDPRDARAWFSLGIRQQENERDDQAIQALLQGIRLEPSLREAYLALSVSYANEGDLREAHNVLEKWISIFHDDREEGTEPAYATMGKIERHQTLANRLMEMARRAPHGDIDADIQVALGVLFNASEEYDKAQDCFRVALQARQDVRSYLLVTQCATLANGGKPEEALQCYEEALNRNPGYVRATFNVGIACIKLCRYEEATDYVIKALRLQQAEALVSYRDSEAALKNGTSEGMWHTLRTAFSQ
ncbi:hypothetical protein QFC22_002614 [Naganishia vaughanmartiniae]|uniref:Uncharacterized protein n=1 Tax=Naganishia vaughanmartiniae TaxID=1424756 RepID=A0ACC2X9H4_9TREE|nr:hypothetical protein QFC22_002614 [Naganishia vaughanmartiniae]